MKSGLNKGFIYSIPLPVKRFTWKRTRDVLENEALLKKEGGLQRDLTDSEALMLHIGYQLGRVDGQSGCNAETGMYDYEL